MTTQRGSAETDEFNPDWIDALADLVQDAHDTIHDNLVVPSRHGATFAEALRLDSPGTRAIAALRADPSTEHLVSLWELAIWSANRFVVSATAQLDGLLAVIRTVHIADAHMAALPIGRSALEHLAAASWILEPLPPKTTMARYVEMLQTSGNAAAGIRSAHREDADRVRSFVDPLVRRLGDSGISRRESAHGHPIRADWSGLVHRAMELPAEIGIEQPVKVTMANEAYGLLCAFTHPNIVELTLRDLRRASGDGVLSVPVASPELVQLTVIACARLLRGAVALLLRVLGSGEGWAERSGQMVRSLLPAA